MTYPILYPGHVIREMRKQKGYTVYRLSDLSGVTQRTIACFEKGKISQKLLFCVPCDMKNYNGRVQYRMGHKIAISENDFAL